MSFGRFSRRQVYGTVNPDNLRDLLTVPIAKQAQHDKSVSAAQGMLFEASALSKDEGDRDKFISEFENERTEVIDQINKHGINSQAAQSIYGLSQKYHQSKTRGPLSEIEGNYARWADWDKRQQSSLDSGKIRQSDYDSMRQMNLAGYKGHASGQIQLKDTAHYNDLEKDALNFADKMGSWSDEQISGWFQEQGAPEHVYQKIATTTKEKRFDVIKDSVVQYLAKSETHRPWIEQQADIQVFRDKQQMIQNTGSKEYLPRVQQQAKQIEDAELGLILNGMETSPERNVAFSASPSAANGTVSLGYGFNLKAQPEWADWLAESGSVTKEQRQILDNYASNPTSANRKAVEEANINLSKEQAKKAYDLAMNEHYLPKAMSMAGGQEQWEQLPIGAQDAILQLQYKGIPGGAEASELIAAGEYRKAANKLGTPKMRDALGDDVSKELAGKLGVAQAKSDFDNMTSNSSYDLATEDGAREFIQGNIRNSRISEILEGTSTSAGLMAQTKEVKRKLYTVKDQVAIDRAKVQYENWINQPPANIGVDVGDGIAIMANSTPEGVGQMITSLEKKNKEMRSDPNAVFDPRYSDNSITHATDIKSRIEERAMGLLEKSHPKDYKKIKELENMTSPGTINGHTVALTDEIATLAQAIPNQNTSQNVGTPIQATMLALHKKYGQGQDFNTFFEKNQKTGQRLLEQYNGYAESAKVYNDIKQKEYAKGYDAETIRYTLPANSGVKNKIKDNLPGMITNKNVKVVGQDGMSLFVDPEGRQLEEGKGLEIADKIANGEVKEVAYMSSPLFGKPTMEITWTEADDDEKKHTTILSIDKFEQANGLPTQVGADASVFLLGDTHWTKKNPVTGEVQQNILGASILEELKAETRYSTIKTTFTPSNITPNLKDMYGNPENIPADDIGSIAAARLVNSSNAKITMEYDEKAKQYTMKIKNTSTGQMVEVPGSSKASLLDLLRVKDFGTALEITQ